MHSVLLYQLTGEPDRDEISSALGNGFPAIEAESIRYLDGHTLYHGSAAARVEEETMVPMVSEDGIATVQERTKRRVHTNWYADLEEGWAGIDTSDGEFFFELLQMSHGVVGESLEVDLVSWTRQFRQHDSAYCWGLSYSEGDDEDAIRAGAGFHGDASMEVLVDNVEDVSQIGFGYDWGDLWVRGVICQSGYVAIYRDWATEQFGRWLVDEVLDHAQYHVDETMQAELSDEECDRCSRTSNLTEYEGGQYCPVCISAFEDGDADAQPEGSADA